MDHIHLFLPIMIESVQQLENLAKEMQLYAKEHQITSEWVKQQEDGSKEVAPGLYRAKGQSATFMLDYTRMIIIGESILQIGYVEVIDGNDTLEQLTVMTPNRTPLEAGCTISIAACFWNFEDKDEWNSIRVAPHTPNYVSLLAKLTPVREPQL